MTPAINRRTTDVESVVSTDVNRRITARSGRTETEEAMETVSQLCTTNRTFINRWRMIPWATKARKMRTKHGPNGLYLESPTIEGKRRLVVIAPTQKNRRPR